MEGITKREARSTSCKDSMRLIKLIKKAKKRGLSILLTMTLVLGLLPGTVHPVKAAIGEIPTANGSDGSQLQPYIIDELNDLLWIADQVNNKSNTFSGKYFMQTKDIDMTGQGWTPIGFNTTITFGGNYDGNGHTISNVSCSSTLDYVGFFGSTKSGSSIKNLTLSNITVANTSSASASRNIGTLVGFSYSSISNCHVTGSSTVTANVVGSMSIGGLVGWSAAAISKCSVNTSVSSSNDVASMGGIVGNQEGSIDNCIYSGTINNAAAIPSNIVGGIVGKTSGGTISHCYCRGSLLSTTTKKGGIAGYFSSGSSYCTPSDNNYYLSGIANHGYGSFGTVADDTGTTARTDAELKDSSNYSGWDFTLVWKNDTEGTTYPYLRTVGTISSSDIDSSNPSSIIVSANVSSDGGDTITNRGAEYIAYGNTDYTKVAATNGGKGSFTVNLTGLPEGIYYVRPYATNSVGTVYGELEKLSFVPSGSGTPSDPYIVDSDEDLYFIRCALDACYILNYDLDLNVSAFHDWIPLGSLGHSFTGTFDGNGHIISGYNAGSITDDSTNTYSGLFGFIGSDGTVKRLGVNGTVSSASYSGGIAAYNAGTISECFNNANISNTFKSAAAGGIVGWNFGSIENCYNSGNISAYPANPSDEYDNVAAGGIAGVDGANGSGTIGSGTESSLISKCYNSGNIYGGANSYNAGITYAFNTNTLIKNCFNAGTISGGTASTLGGISTGEGALTNCDFLTQTGLTLKGTTGTGTGEASPTYFTASTGTSYNNFYTAAGWNFTDTWKFVSGGYPTLKVFTPVVSAVISTSYGLKEQNLNNSSLTVTLNYTTFNATLDKLAFSLNGAPAGTSIASVTRTSGTVCTVAINYDNTDFDLNTGISLNIAASQLASGTNLTTNELSITATDEAVPTVSSLLPNGGPLAGGTSVTITGTDLTDVSAIYFGSNAASFTEISSTSITAISPAGTGTADVTVVTRGGTSATHSLDRFTYFGIPTVTGVTPANGPLAGTSVVITGTGFTSATHVKFNLADAAFTFNSDTQITATAPAGSAGTVNITVTTLGGTSATSVNDRFTYVAPPTVTIDSTASSSTNSSPIPITITFSNSVTGFTAGDITVNGGTINNFAGSGTTYTANLTPSGQGTVTADIAAGAASDTVGNGNVVATQFSRTYDSVAPTVSITSTTGNPTNISPIPVTITFSENVSGFTAGDITVSGGTLGNFTGSGMTYSAEITPSGNGIVTADIAGSIAKDAASNNNTAASQLSRTYNGTPPNVVITSAASSSTNSSPIPITITFSDSVTGFTAGDITVSGGTLSNFAGSGTTYTADLTPSGQGTVTANIAAGAASDTAGNGNTVATQFSRTYDSAAPTVAITSTTGNSTNISPLPVTITFSENVSGFTAGDITVSGGTLGNFTGSGMTYSAEITPLGNGIVTADIAGSIAKDAAGNNNTAAVQLSRAFDGTPPTVAITSAAPSSTNSSLIPITVTFSDSVTGFTAADITVSGGTLSNFAGSGTTYTAGLTPSGQGTVTANIAAGAASDTAGNGNTVATQFSRTYDSVAPTVSITSTTGSPTNISPIPVTITFSENVSGFTVGDITVSGGTLGNFTGSGMTYSAEITPSGNGIVTADIAGSIAKDAAGNNNTAATQLSRAFDGTPPTVAITSTASSSTNNLPIPITITFSDSVTGFTSGDITVSGGTLSNFAGSGTTYTAALIPSGQGTVTADIAAGATSDAAGNSNTVAAQFSRTYDSSTPTVSITSTTGSLTNISPIPVTITFSESVTGFIAGDITINGGTLTNFAGSGTTYTADLTPSGQGTVTADIAAGAASDTAGNGNTEAVQFSRTYDSVAPTVTITTTTGNPTNISPIPVTIIFSESVAGFTANDITVSGGTLGNFSGSGMTYAAEITPLGNGAVTADIAGSIAKDAAGNDNTAAAQLLRTYNGIALTVSITSTASSYSSASTIPITITFNESVSDFSISDIVVNGGTLGNFSGSGAIYTAVITPSGQGTVKAEIAAGAASDTVGNSSAAATLSVTVTDTVTPSPSTPSNSPVGQNQEADNTVPTEVGSNKQGWDAITDSIEQLIIESPSENVTSTITIDMNHTTIVPKKILETIQGQNVTVTFNVADGIEWSINGNDVAGGANGSDLNSIDMQVELGADNIPQELIENLPVTKEAAMQFSLVHEGSFGFQATLTIDLDDKNQGKIANLFYYNPDTRKLELQSVRRIDKDGNAQFDFVHASDYVIVMDSGKTLQQLMNQIMVTPSQKVLYISGNKGKSSTLSVKLPVSLKKVTDNRNCDYSISYTSSNPDIATVSSNGRVTAKKAGTTTITTIINVNGTEKRFQTKITVKKAFIKLVKSTASMTQGEQYTFQAKGYGIDSSDIRWSTSVNSIVVIDKNSGIATAKAIGIDYVTAIYKGIAVKMKVIVKN